MIAHRILLAIVLSLWLAALVRFLAIDQKVRRLGLSVPWQSHAMKLVIVVAIAFNVIMISRIENGP